jgi:primosomal protein N' (replication factor Y)
MFYETEIAIREQLKYPPFCDIIVISFNSVDEKELKQTSNMVYEYVKNNLDESFKVFVPMPAPIDKIQNQIRYRIIIKGNMDENARTILNNCLKQAYSKNLKNTRVNIDVNPNNMM